MSKISNLKNYIKSYRMIFDRITKGYTLHNATSFICNYLSFKSPAGEVKIDQVKPNVIKVLKKESDTKTAETINFKYDEIVSIERIRVNNTKEDVIRRYSETDLNVLDSKITLNSDQFNETVINISIDKEKVIVNGRDVTLLFDPKVESIEERYKILRENYTKSKEEPQVVAKTTANQSKSKRQIIVEEQLRDFIREEFNYKAPLEKRDLEDLLRIINMLIKRRKSTGETQKQYKKQ